MANTVYDNFYLSNEIEDQYKSHLDLQTFCTVDNALEGTAGMLRKINVYKATDGTEKLAMGAGNSKSIEVGFTPREYRIQLAQNRFKYYDEQAMTDPQLVPVGTKHKAKGFDTYMVKVGDLYKIQVGAFKVKANAEATLKKLQAAGFSAFITTEEGAGKSVDELAREVLQGKWGNGAERKKRLEAAGYDYAAVQKKVNQLA